MKQCPNCHAEVQDDAKFCGSCGCKLEIAQPENQQAAPQQTIYQQTPPQQPESPQQAVYQQTPPQQPEPPQQAVYQQTPPQQPEPPQQAAYQQTPPQQPEPPQQAAYQQTPPQQQKKHWDINTTGQLVWSILNLLFCCMPLGIWSLILTTTVTNAPTYEEAQKKMKQAKTINLISTILGGILVIGTIIFYVVAIVLSAGAQYY